MGSEERRVSQVQMSGDIGEIKGAVKGIEKSLDTFIQTVGKKHGEQDAKIKANAESVSAVAKKVDRFTWTGAGIGGTLTGLYGVLVVKGDAFKKAIGTFFGGD